MNKKTELQKAIEKLRVHDHLCLIYETREEQFSAVIPFIKEGLDRGEKCVYIADDNTAEQVLEVMGNKGIDTASAMRSGALIIANKRTAYLKEGYFDPDLMIRFLKDFVDSARKEGFAALRATGEMTWALGDDPGTERLIEYEAKLNYFFPENDALAICQYNRSRFKPEIILDVIKTHPLVIYGNLICDNFYYVPPDEFLKPGTQYLEVERLLKAIMSREKAEKELKKALDDLERSNKDLEQFAYIASHDLQEPLRMISSFMQLLEMRYKGRLDEQADEYIKFAVEGASRMQMLINDLLIYSRVATKGMPFKLVDSNAALKRAIENLKLLINDSGALIETGALPMAEADESQLSQVFQNLISNAIKFRKPAEPPRVHISAEFRSNEWVFCVRDNGMGIDPKYKDLVFVPFQRLHGRKYPGSGIGLAICKRIIERHNGSIWVESELDQGAAFFFAIPAK